MSETPVEYGEPGSVAEIDHLWKKITRYLRSGAGDPTARRLLEETLVVLSQKEKP